MVDRKFNAILDTRPEITWPCVIEKTDFKQVLKFFRLLEDPEIDNTEKYYYMIRIFFKKVPQDPPDVVTRNVIAFIMGKTKESEDDADGEGGKNKKVFCWNQDHGRLFSAFWQAYKIDLRNVKLHWWAFNELFQNLPDTTRLMQTIELRGRKPRKGDSAESKKDLAKAQRAVALEQDSGNESELDDFFNAMVRG
jgi:hypothetical protein